MKYIVIKYELFIEPLKDCDFMENIPYDKFDAIEGPDNLSDEQIVNNHFLNDYYTQPVTKENGFFIPQDREEKIKVTNIDNVSKEDWDIAFLAKYS